MSTETEQTEVVRVDCPWCGSEGVLVYFGRLFPHGDELLGRSWCPVRGETPEVAEQMAAEHRRIRHRGHP